MKYKIITVDSWPGPEDAGVSSMALRQEYFVSSVLGALIARSEFDEAVAKQVQKFGDPGGDPWDLASS